MNSIWLSITLQTDTAITESSATVGGHRTLGYVPGASLLGAAAAGGRYPAKDADAAWRRFHSGAVRFGPGLPLGQDGAACLPVPLCLHYPKDAGDPALTSDVVNLARAERGDRQLQQLRGGFLDGTLARAEGGARSSMRTAVGADGRAREGFLYSISAIPAGRTFLARVDADDPADLQLVRESLAGRLIRLGRSRKSEFGRAKVEVADPPQGAWKCGEPTDGTAVFLCVSDLALRDPETGAPAFEPRPSEFGLPAGWTWSASRSFLRVRRYSPFNAHRRRPDAERQVIVAGSVLVFQGQGRPDAGAVRKTLAKGVGSYRAEGLGQLLFEPALLGGEKPAAVSVGRAATAAAAPVAAPKGELLQWLDLRDQERRDADEAWDEAMEWIGKLKEGKRWHKLPPSQWGEVRGIARAFRGKPKQALLEKLRAHVVAPESRDGHRSVRHLERLWGHKDRKGWGKSLGERLCDLVKDAKARDAAAALELLAIHIVRAERAQEDER